MTLKRFSTEATHFYDWGPKIKCGHMQVFMSQEKNKKAWRVYKYMHVYIKSLCMRCQNIMQVTNYNTQAKPSDSHCQYMCQENHYHLSLISQNWSQKVILELELRMFSYFSMFNRKWGWKKVHEYQSFLKPFFTTPQNYCRNLNSYHKKSLLRFKR